MDACNVTDKKTQNRILAKNICILLMLILVFAGFLKCMDFSNQLEVYYYGNNSSSYQGEMAQTFWDTGSGYSEENSSFYSVFKRLAAFSYKMTDRDCRVPAWIFQPVTRRLALQESK